MQTNHYIVDDEGNFRFTSVGLEEEGPLLVKAGIDPTSIKTYEAYIQARKTAGLTLWITSETKLTACWKVSRTP